MTPRLPGENGRSPRSRRQQDGATMLALVFVFLVIAGFIGLVCTVLPAFGRIVFVFAGLAAFIALHYVTWGRWLMNSMKADEERDEEL